MQSEWHADPRKTFYLIASNHLTKIKQWENLSINPGFHPIRHTKEIDHFVSTMAKRIALMNFTVNPIGIAATGRYNFLVSTFLYNARVFPNIRSHSRNQSDYPRRVATAERRVHARLQLNYRHLGQRDHAARPTTSFTIVAQ